MFDVLGKLPAGYCDPGRCEVAVDRFGLYEVDLVPSRQKGAYGLRARTAERDQEAARRVSRGRQDQAGEVGAELEGLQTRRYIPLVALAFLAVGGAAGRQTLGQSPTVARHSDLGWCIGAGR